MCAARRTVAAVALAAAALFVFPAGAGVNAWTRVGPPCAYVNELAPAPTDPNLVFAATSAGVWRSTDGGQTWARAGTELAGEIVTTVAFPAADGSVVLAFATHSGVWRSTDTGATWTLVLQRASSPWPDWDGAVAVAPSDRSVALAAEFGRTARSTDGGLTWTIYADPFLYGASDLAIKADDPQRALAVGFGFWYVTTDGGATWGGSTITGSYPNDVAWSPTAPDVALMAAGAVWRSTDGGQTFNSVSAGPVTFQSVAFDPATGHAYAAGEGGVLRRSTDGGATWSDVATGAARGTGEALAAWGGASGVVEVAAGTGLIRSTDGGASWNPAWSGIEAAATGDVAFTGGSPSRLWAGCWAGGLYASDDAGSSWSLLGPPGPTRGTVRRLGEVPYDPARVAVVATDGGAWEAMRTDDGGATWTELTPPYIYPDGASDIALTGRPSVTLVPGYYHLYRTTDGGTTWDIPFDLAGAAAVAPDDPDLVATVGSGDGWDFTLGLSTDGGLTWGVLWTSVASSHWSGGMGLGPASRPDLYATLEDGSLVLQPLGRGGSGTTRVLDPDPGSQDPARAVAVNPADPNEIVVAFPGSGVRRTTDRGGLWLPLNAGLADLRVLDLAYDPADPSRIAAATPSGVYLIELGPLSIAGVSPAVVAVGSGDTTLTVTGSGFDAATAAYLDGAPAATTYGDPSTLQLVLPAATAAAPGFHRVAAVSAAGVASNTAAVAVRFLDVPEGHWAFDFIHLAATEGVTAGCGGGDFCPDGAVTRAQMAVFLLAAEHGPGYTPPPCEGMFADVPCSHWAAVWIEQLAREGITAGCGGGNYCPGDPVTRAQMAVFLLAAEHGIGYAPPACEGMFADVPCSHWAAAWIEQLFREGITAGCGGGNYCPEDPVTRAQMAVFLAATWGWTVPGLW